MNDYKWKIVPDGKGWWDIYRRPNNWVRWPMWECVSSIYGKQKAIDAVESMKEDKIIYL